MRPRRYRSHCAAVRQNCAATARTAKPCLPAPPKISGANTNCPRICRARSFLSIATSISSRLAHLLGASPLLGVVLVDRHRARIFDLRLGELTEREDLFHPLPRRGRSDGFAGYDGGHAQRRVEDEARQHFKNVAETLKGLLEKGVFEKWILACQDAHRSAAGAATASLRQSGADWPLSCGCRRTSRETRSAPTRSRLSSDGKTIAGANLCNQALSQARSHGRGVTGLRRVLRSLEMGEVQTLLIGENLQAHAVECSACGHIDAHLVSYCPVCGRATQEIVDVGEAILPWVVRRDIETFYVKDDPEFDKVGNIAALLRFRSEKVQPISTADRGSIGKGRGRVSRPPAQVRQPVNFRAGKKRPTKLTRTDEPGSEKRCREVPGSRATRIEHVHARFQLLTITPA